MQSSERTEVDEVTARTALDTVAAGVVVEVVAWPNLSENTQALCVVVVGVWAAGVATR